MQYIERRSKRPRISEDSYIFRFYEEEKQTKKNCVMSFFAHVKQAPPNAIFHTTTRFKKDTSAVKVNLGVGAYRDEKGKPWVLPTVKLAEKKIYEGVVNDEINHEYLPITGLDAFVSEAAKLVLGTKSAAIAEGRVSGVQALSGTGALRLGAEFLSNNIMSAGKPIIYISAPTWSNHRTIFTLAGFEVRNYRYYDASTRGFDCKGMIADLEAAPQGATVLLHSCAHNPTGVDPGPQDWKKIRDVVRSKGLFPFFDSAYQGFASGDLEKDSFAIRSFAEARMSFFVAQSFAKNFGLYNERAGCLHMVCQSTTEAAALKSRVALVIRPMYSNPPSHGARIVAVALTSPELTRQWHKDIRTMSGRILKMRQALVSALKARGAPGSWEHITNQIGMFSFTGLTVPQVNFVERKYHVYMLSSGRISMAGVNEGNVDHIAAAIADAVKTIPEDESKL
eukprot:g1721.t1